MTGQSVFLFVALFALCNASNIQFSTNGHRRLVSPQLLSKLLPTPQKFGSTLESFALDIPTALALLGSFGDDVELPTYYTSSAKEEIRIEYARVLNASLLTVGAAMSGRTLSLNVTIPSAVFLCIVCPYQAVEWSFGPPESTIYFDDFKYEINEMKMSLTADLTERNFASGEVEGSLAFENVTTSFSIRECFLFIRKGQRFWFNGTVEPFSNYREDFSEMLEAGYEEEKEYLSVIIGEGYTNCFLGGYDNAWRCLWYFRGQSTRHWAFAQILHVLGLVASRKAPEFTKPISEIIDPYVKMNKVLFHYGTYLIQTVKYLTLFEYGGDGPDFPDFFYEQISTNCTEDETSCDTFRNTIGNGGEKTTMTGHRETSAFSSIINYRIDYEYKLPNLVLKCNDFWRNSDNLAAELLLKYEGLEFAIANAKFGLIGEFTSNENGIIQLVNSDFKFSLFLANMYFPTVTSYDHGRREDLPPLTVDLASEILSLWESTDENGVRFQHKYSQYLENLINDFLAGKISI